MKFLFDFFPLLLFFVTYKVGAGHEQASLALIHQYLGGLMASGQVPASQAPIILASAVGIVATVLQIGYLLVRGRKVDGMLWITLAVIVVMGGATIYLHDDAFIKWKPTILYWVFGAVLFVAHVFFKKNLMRKVMGDALTLPDVVWTRVVYAWMAFLCFLGALNLVMAFVVLKGDTAAWVNFKVFGATAIFFAFVVGQTFFLFKYVEEEKA
jgi:intracellular septation protein